ncbi:MAG: hypothetical protein GYA24_11445 [Candidatus Lokiarchaeota archaeon]|nr:hypothetical protein [Candidatus Lokiarchaeota archaeon]
MAIAVMVLPRPMATSNEWPVAAINPRGSEKISPVAKAICPEEYAYAGMLDDHVLVQETRASSLLHGI